MLVARIAMLLIGQREDQAVHVQVEFGVEGRLVEALAVSVRILRVLLLHKAERNFRHVLDESHVGVQVAVGDKLRHLIEVVRLHVPQAVVAGMGPQVVYVPDVPLGDALVVGLRPLARRRKYGAVLVFVEQGLGLSGGDVAERAAQPFIIHL